MEKVRELDNGRDFDEESWTYGDSEKSELGEDVGEDLKENDFGEGDIFVPL